MKMKRLLTGFLSATMLATSLPFTALAAGESGSQILNGTFDTGSQTLNFDLSLTAKNTNIGGGQIMIQYDATKLEPLSTTGAAITTANAKTQAKKNIVLSEDSENAGNVIDFVSYANYDLTNHVFYAGYVGTLMDGAEFGTLKFKLKNGLTENDLDKNSIVAADNTVRDVVGAIDTAIDPTNDANYLLTKELVTLSNSNGNYVDSVTYPNSDKDPGGVTPPADPVAPTNVTLSADKTTVTTGTSVNFTAGATAADGGALTYALYSNTTDSTTGATEVAAYQAGTSFTVTPALGTTYYFVTAKNTLNGKDATANSATTAIVVSNPTPAGNAQLSALHLSDVAGTIQNRDLIHMNGTNMEYGFSADVLSYDLYFKTGETKSYKVKLESDDEITYKLAGGTETGYDKVNGIAVTAGQKLDIIVSNATAGKTAQTYTINSKDLSTAIPQATFMLSNKGPKAGVSVLKLDAGAFKNAENANSFDFTLNLKDTSAFSMFSDSEAATLADGTEQKANTKAFAFNDGGTGLKVETVKVSNTGKTLNIKVVMPDGNKGGVDMSKVSLSLYLASTDPNNAMPTKDAVKTIESTTASKLADIRVIDSAIGDDGKNAAATSLILFTAEPETGMPFAMYFNKVGNNANIKDFTYRVTKSGMTDLTGNLSDLFGGMKVTLESGTYKVTVEGPGHIKYEKEITMTGKAQTIPAIMLIAGDVNNDGKVDSADRTALLGTSVYGKTVAAGDTTLKPYDFNGDMVIDILDLGIMIRNYGASYK